MAREQEIKVVAVKGGINRTLTVNAEAKVISSVVFAIRLCVMNSNQELSDMHCMYAKADSNAALTRRLYKKRYPQRQCRNLKTFLRLHRRLCEHEKFNSPDFGRGRPTSAVEQKILDAVKDSYQHTVSVASECPSSLYLETSTRLVARV